ncbi:hypothetical protein TWF281_002745 [Arthrobotrys megalospora]
MAAWMKDPYWNLDLSSTTSNSPAPVSTSPASNSPEIPLSTIVYRTLDMKEKLVQSKASSDFNPLILRLRQQVQELLSKAPKLDLSFITAPAYKFIWVASVIITTYIVLEVSVAVYKSYMASVASDGPSGPVIPIDPTQPLPTPVPTIPDPPAPSTKRSAHSGRSSNKRDVRVKLFSEILTGYLTIVLSVSFLLGDSIILKFLMTGLTGFVGLVSLMLPDEAEWGPQLYNFQEGGFEMKEIPIITTTSADGDESLVFEREVEEKESMKKRAELKAREMRDKVVERIQEVGSATKKEALSVSQKVKEVINSVKSDFEDINSKESEEEQRQKSTQGQGSGSPDEDLKSQLSNVMAPIERILDTDSSIARASRKVEEWLLKGGDSFGSDNDEPVESSLKTQSPASHGPPTTPVPTPRPLSGDFGNGTLRLR